MLINVLIGLVTLYLVLCAALFLSQRSMLYFPPPISNRRASAQMTLQIGNERILVSTRIIDSSDAIIYLGGNAEDVSFNMPELSSAFPGHALYLLHYRGYGGSSGSPSEEALFGDALALYDKVRAGHSRVVIIGRSLGSGIAVRLASVRDVAALVLVTPYDSIQDIAASHFAFFPVRWMLRDKYESWRYAPKVQAPTSIIAAELDEIIPRTSTELLRTRFQNGDVPFDVIPGAGHNSIAESGNYLPLLIRAVSIRRN